MLRICTFQLSLFPPGTFVQLRAPLAPHDIFPVQSFDRDARSSLQWLRAILGRLECGSGDCWRRLSDPIQRNDPEREWYLNGIRLIKPIIACSSPLPIRALEKKTDEIIAAKLALKPRCELVAELMAANPVLTDKKILSPQPDQAGPDASSGSRSEARPGEDRLKTGRGRPRGGAMTFTEISRKTGIPRSTVYGIYRRVEERFIIAYLMASRRNEERIKLAAA